MIARILGAMVLTQATMGTAMACGATYAIDARELARTVNKQGKVKTVTWALRATHPFGQSQRTRMVGGAPEGSWVRFSSDGRWTARIGLENDLRVRPVEMKVAFGFSLGDASHSGLIPTVWSDAITVPKRGARWTDAGGKRGPKGVTWDMLLQGNVAPLWTVSCAVHG